MTPLLNIMRIGGLWAEHDGSGRLIVGPRSLLTDSARAFVRANRDAIVAEIAVSRLGETMLDTPGTPATGVNRTASATNRGQARVETDLTGVLGLVQRLSDHGVVVEHTGTGEIALSGERPPDAMIRELKANKAAVVALLTLEWRLSLGWALCEAEPDPVRRSKLEDRWIAVLHDYERACDAPLLQEAA